MPSIGPTSDNVSPSGGLMYRTRSEIGGDTRPAPLVQKVAPEDRISRTLAETPVSLAGVERLGTTARLGVPPRTAIKLVLNRDEKSVDLAAAANIQQCLDATHSSGDIQLDACV